MNRNAKTFQFESFASSGSELELNGTVLVIMHKDYDLYGKQ